MRDAYRLKRKSPAVKPGIFFSAVPGIFVVEAVADAQHQEVGHVEIAQTVSDVDV